MLFGGSWSMVVADEVLASANFLLARAEVDEARDRSRARESENRSSACKASRLWRRLRRAISSNGSCGATSRDELRKPLVARPVDCESLRHGPSPSRRMRGGIPPPTTVRATSLRRIAPRRWRLQLCQSLRHHG